MHLPENRARAHPTFPAVCKTQGQSTPKRQDPWPARLRSRPAEFVQSRSDPRAVPEFMGLKCAPRRMVLLSVPAPKAHCWNPEHGGTAPRKSWLTLYPFRKGTGPPVKPVLLDPCAAALDQNDQYDHKQNAGNNPDNRGAVHNEFPLFQLKVSYVPQSVPGPSDTRRQSGEVFGPQDCGGCQRRSCNFTAPPEHSRSLRYLTCVRRRWIRTTSTTTNRTPATIRIIVVLSISTFLSHKSLIPSF